MSDQQQSVLGLGELLSLTEAAKLTPYTPAYLNLLARQGKLPAMKIARNWVTSTGAISAYLKKQSAYHLEMAQKLSDFRKEQV
jgi:hypothetical protein